MAMIFILLIFTAMLFAAMQNKSKAVMQAAHQEVAAAKAESARLAAVIAQLKSQKTCASGPGANLAANPESLLKSAELITTAGHYRPSEVGKAPTPPQVSGSGALIAVEYRSDSFALDTAAKARLEADLAKDQIDSGATKVEITAEQATAAGGASDAQRAAFFRAIAIRNELLARGWRAADISVKMPYREEGHGPAHAFIRVYPK
jgi:hypothetical protein